MNSHDKAERYTLKENFLFNAKLIVNISMVLSAIFLGCFSAYYQEPELLYVALCVLSFFLIFKRPVIAIIMILSVLSIYQLLGYTPHFEIGTFNIFLGDVLAIIFATTAILRLSMDTQSQIIIHSFHWKLFVIFCVLAIVAILRGLPYYDQTAIVVARGHIYMIATTAYFCTFRFDKRLISRIFAIFVVFGLVLLGISYLRWFGVLFFFEYLSLYRGTWRSMTTLNRMGAFYLVFILFVFISSKITKIEKKHILSWIAIVSLAIAIALIQIRTMWVVAFAGWVILAVRYRSILITKTTIALLLLLIMVFLLWSYRPTLVSQYRDSLYNAATVFWKPENTTLSWRMEVNRIYLANISLKDYILGTPFGTPINWEIEGLQYKASAHNMFVWQIYHTGILGLFAFIALQISLIRRISKVIKSERDKLIKNSLVILWIALICYQVNFMAWTADLLYPVILGISMSIIAHYQGDRKLRLAKVEN